LISRKDAKEKMISGLSALVRLLDSVIPAWSAGIQANSDVSGRILRAWMPAIHADMTKASISCSVGERKLMNHFVVT